MGPTTDVAGWTLSWVRDSQTYANRGLALRGVLGHCLEGGLLCEFGVYEGESANCIADLVAPRTVHGFDSFEGLPETSPELFRDNWPKGAFRPMGIPWVRPNVVLHVGWFAETVPRFVAETSGLASFLHIDSDLYSSAKDVLWAMRPKIVTGTIILFDEYLWWPGWESKGEARAWAEFVEGTGLKFDCLATVAGNEQVAVRIR